MERGQLEAFVTVFRLQSITRAAEELSLAQSSVSARIRALEAELGAPMFDRTPGGVVPTSAGRKFLPFARAALDTMEEGRRAVEATRARHPRSLDVGALTATGTQLLPPIISVFASTHPDVDVRVRKGCAEEIVEWLLRREIAVGLSRDVSHPAIVSRVIVPDELVLVCAPRHHFAVTGKVGLQELADHGVIFYTRKPNFYDFFHTTGLSPRFRYEVDSIEAVKRLVALNLGVGIVPLLRVQDELRAGKLQRVEMVGVGPIRRDVYVIHRPEATNMPVVRRFVEAAMLIGRMHPHSPGRPAHDRMPAPTAMV